MRLFLTNKKLSCMDQYTVAFSYSQGINFIVDGETELLITHFLRNKTIKIFIMN